jgi:gamma-glutamyltranspeptidase/glutathione hydrolase
MGGSMQAQIHVQVLTRLLDRGMHIDEALDAPRFDAVLGNGDDGPILGLEGRFSHGTLEGIRERGNTVQLWPAYTAAAGHAHIIEVADSGSYVGASDPRTDSLALGF